MEQGGEEKSNRKKNDELDKLLKEVLEEKILDKYLDSQDDDNENSDKFYEKTEHALQKKVHFYLVVEDEGHVRQLLADVSKQNYQFRMFLINCNEASSFLRIFLSMINKETGCFTR